jgi:hypothetical protein
MEGTKRGGVLGNFDNLREKEYLRKVVVRLDLKNKIYDANLIELVKTIEEETNKLFDKLPDKTKLQRSLVFFCANYMRGVRDVLSDTILDSLIKILEQEDVSISSLSTQDIHRLIMILALNAYTQSNIPELSKEAKKLQDLVEEMDLIK